MSKGNIDSSNAVADACDNSHAITPCACCQALAQVRMPWINRENQRPNNDQYQAQNNGQNNYSKLNTASVLLNKLNKTLQPDEKKSTDKSSPKAINTKSQDTKSNDKKDSASATSDSDTNWHEDLSTPKTKQIWSGLAGLTITIFGMAVPFLMLIAFCLSTPKRLTLVLINHPLETIAELLLVLLIPLANYVIWQAFCKHKTGFSRPSIIALGAAISAAIIVAAVSIAGMLAGSQALAYASGTEFTAGFAWIGTLSLITACVSGYLANSIRLTRQLEQSRKLVVTYLLAGMSLSVLTFLAAEYRPWTIRIAETKAVSASARQRQEGLSALRQMNPERQLRIECSDARACGLPGLFLPLKSSMQQELYFALTGKPFSFTDINNSDLSSMPDSYLSRNVVGDKIPNLVLTRSTASAVIHADTLSSTINWTFVFKNGSASAQEARAEIGLPPGAVISGLTLWSQGEAENASFAPAGTSDGQSISASDTNSQAMVTDLGHGRTLMRCSPVPQDEELKVRVTMVVPLKPDSSKSASVTLPNLIASNFDLSGDQLLQFRSTNPLSSNLKTLGESISADQQHILSGQLSTDALQTTDVIITAQRDGINKPVALLDKLAVEILEEEESKKAEAQKNDSEQSTNKVGEVVVMIDGSKGVKNQLEEIHQALNRKNENAEDKTKPIPIRTVEPLYLVQDVTKVAAPAPKHLVIVIDGSATMKDHLHDLTKALAKLPSGIPVSVLIASQEHEDLMQPLPLAAAIKKLTHLDFAGGQDNLQTVVKASELAGETKGGAVLWIHGAQPVLNQEIYIMSPYVDTPAFYELSLGGGTDTFEFFKNHKEIGPFSPVPRTTPKLADDLIAFFCRWQPNSQAYAITLSETLQKPDNAITPSPEEAQELLALYANQKSAHLIARGHKHQAATIAVNYGIVSPVSCALVTANSQRSESTDSEQGGVQSTVIQGVNTAGTVRVNNLANLEALLNIIANLGEIGALILGVVLIVNGFVSKSVYALGPEIEIGSRGKILIGTSLILIGLVLPGMLNWLVASCRDANLFS